MTMQYYVVCRETATVIRAQRWIPESRTYGETIDAGWNCMTLAELHRNRLFREIGLKDLEVLQLSDAQVAEWDAEHERLTSGDLYTWECPGCGASLQEGDTSHGDYCNVECEERHKDDMEAEIRYKEETCQ